MLQERVSPIGLVSGAEEAPSFSVYICSQQKRGALSTNLGPSSPLRRDASFCVVGAKSERTYLIIKLNENVTSTTGVSFPPKPLREAVRVLAQMIPYGGLGRSTFATVLVDFRSQAENAHLQLDRVCFSLLCSN